VTDVRERSPGRTLRALTGVDEEILSAVPNERARYTAMGGIVLGTATMAMFSMTVALFCVFGEASPLAFTFVPVWGMFILFLDRWLMATTQAKHGWERFRKLFPRFLLAVVFGVIIAEPLLLGVFHTAIEQRIREDRAAALLSHEANLRRCNPVPGTPEADSGVAAEAGCRRFRLGVTTDSEAKQEELKRATQQRDELKATVDADTKAYADLEQKAREECNGTSGAGLTGQVGEGPNCRRLRGEADQYRADHRIDENNQRLAALNDQIVSLTGEVGDSRSSAAGRIDKDISDSVDRQRRDQKAEMGILERLRALGDLAEDDGYVLAAEWGLRIFFIVVDSLPVLLKFLSGFSTYDDAVVDRLRRQGRTQRVVNETERRDAVLREELQRHQLIVEHAEARKKVEFDARMRHIDVDVLREDLIDRRAAFLLGESNTIRLSNVPRRDPHDETRSG
jgi:hypothetical protein